MHIVIFMGMESYLGQQSAANKKGSNTSLYRRSRYLLLLMLTFSCFYSNAQQHNAAGDSIAMLPEVKIRAKWISDTDRYHYNQMKFYVTTVMPYVEAATKLFKDINAKSEDPETSRKDRRKYINDKEEEMRTKFEDKVKSLNVTQGALLVKLISRQTELNLYKILTDFKNPLVAIKWQTWARLNGMNLDRKYHPEEEPDLENIMEELGYPLPKGYAAAYTAGG